MKDSGSEDIQILELFGINEEMAFRRLFDRYYMALCIYSMQLTDTFDLSEDLVQDVLLRFWEKRVFENISTSLRSYLYAAVRNETLQYLKRERLLSTEQLTGVEVDIPENEYNEEELIDIKNRLKIALDKLPPQEYLSIKSVILENRKYKEAAEYLGISINTLKTHLTRALKTLRKQGNLRLLLVYIICFPIGTN